MKNNLILTFILIPLLSYSQNDSSALKSDKKLSSQVHHPKIISLEGKSYKVTFKAQPVLANESVVKKPLEIKNNRNENISGNQPPVNPEIKNEDKAVPQTDMNTNEKIVPEQKKDVLEKPVINEDTNDQPENQTGLKDSTKQDKNAKSNEQNNNNSKVLASAANGLQPDQSLDGQQMIVNFSDGKIQSAIMPDKNYESCPFTVNNVEKNALYFTASCKSAESSKKAKWNGVVEGNLIKGNFSWLVGTGATVDYSFTGIAIKKLKKKNTSAK